MKAARVFVPGTAAWGKPDFLEAEQIQIEVASESDSPVGARAAAAESAPIHRSRRGRGPELPIPAPPIVQDAANDVHSSLREERWPSRRRTWPRNG